MFLIAIDSKLSGANFDFLDITIPYKNSENCERVFIQFVKKREEYKENSFILVSKPNEDNEDFDYIDENGIEEEKLSNKYIPNDIEKNPFTERI